MDKTELTVDGYYKIYNKIKQKNTYELQIAVFDIGHDLL
jgi:hypothetical protein